jgi:hypothetical protein
MISAKLVKNLVTEVPNALSFKSLLNKSAGEL